jgi:hypothetical protein
MPAGSEISGVGGGNDSRVLKGIGGYDTFVTTTTENTIAYAIICF